MNQKTFKPNLDLVVARLSIFGMVAIVYTALSANGLPSWFLWLVLLWGVFSIFEAAIKADEVLEGAVNTQTVLDDLTKRVIIQHRIIKYQDQSINQLIERKYKEIKQLKAAHHGETIGHEHHLKKVKQERDEIRTLVSMNTSNKSVNEGWDL
ncbi:hypothetical protein HN247_11975 [Acinetobacter baumannii]|uniref:hypothetical protein n=1 Tax=Acinetobacter baumannii TaxID=470 RepID=UPI00189938F2|nr:hypothetical protein [Acinetobacter baumannii]MBF6951830.1 hypothetical protein [Acinetobacter baumannii]MBF6967456.1 hypothetical protein [Acinetobacter baumannii]MBF8382876.1 hypothetical protein [Acinetobacter baumannii]MBH8502094.1 hypothetical protein [Acinetobacter baumannii]MBJ3830295.1 hypothetical protein [Acinetobacter baumannii]